MYIVVLSNKVVVIACWSVAKYIKVKARFQLGETPCMGKGIMQKRNKNEYNQEVKQSIYYRYGVIVTNRKANVPTPNQYTHAIASILLIHDPLLDKIT